MVINEIELSPGTEHEKLVDYEEGFYLVNDNLYIVSTELIVTMIWSSVSGYLGNVPESSELPKLTPQREDTISEDFLLKVLAIAKEPALIKDISLK